MSGGAMNEIPEGINLRKEAQKIDLKQFDSSDVEHVIPIISVMRPPTGFRELKGTPAASSLNPQAHGQNKESKEAATAQPVEEEATNYTKKKAEREANKQMDRYNRAWKRLRPEIDSPRETKQLKIEENETREDSSTILPSLHVNKRPNTQSSNHVRSHTVGIRNNTYASSTTAR